jgi:predicted ATP-dependent endonuclease of OLD family
MHLQRVQVPNFRALKNIDITFEKERIPRIFPLASLNGGGKSTLLQLIFTLLTCSAEPDKHEFLINILKDFEIDNDCGGTLAMITLLDGENNIDLHFSCYTTNYLVDKFYEGDDITGLVKNLGFVECSNYYHVLDNQYQHLANRMNNIVANIQLLTNKKDFVETRQDNVSLESFRNSDNPQIVATSLYSIVEGEDELKLIEYRKSFEELDLARINKLNECAELLSALRIKNNVVDNLLLNNTHHICSYRLKNNGDELNVLCQVRCDGENTDILRKASRKVFLSAPASQVFLFFNRQEISCLFGNSTNGETYEYVAQKSQDRLAGFFPHNCSIIKNLAEAFEKAKENDWQQAIKTRGQYGNEYARICKDLEYVFSGKSIEPLKDLSGIVMKTIENGQERIFHPEDLSHGELRRLTFYAWLRTKEIKDSIVLVDEIEIGLHPDWQYQIVKDLEEWAPSNQYILATHSYEICSALTPAHVKEIEPKLVKPETASAH